MVRNGEMGLANVKRVFRRYWWILLITTFTLGAIAIAAAKVLPRKYTSQTLVVVEQPTVGPDYVKPVITEDSNHRLSAMQGQILSRTRLQPIVQKFGLYPKDRDRMQMDELVDKLRGDISVTPMEPMPGTQRGQLPGFYVSVTFENPQLAQQICTEVTSMFLAQSAGDRKKQAKVTTDFLSQQLEEAKRSLDEQDDKLAKFKRQNLGALPEEEQTNMTILAGMNAQLEANTQALSRAQQDKAFNESLLTAQENSWKAAQTGVNPETTEQQLTMLQEQLATLESRYTSEHPDVIKLKNQIEQLKKQQAAAPKGNSASAGSPALTEPPQIQQLRAKLRQNEISINDLMKRQAQIQEQTRQLQGRVQSSPMVEQQFKELMRNYQTAQDFYNDLLKKRQNAGVAGDLEGQEESERFQVYDPPGLPDKPSFPKMMNFAAAGFGGGLALGVAILYLLAFTDKCIHSERDVELALKLPVLTLVPTLDVAARQVRRTLRVLDKSA